MAKERVAPGIYKAAAGVYDLVVSTGKGPDGKHRQTTKRVRGTLNEAKSERAKLQTAVAAGQLTTDDLTVAELHARYMELRKPTLAPRTIELYDYFFAKAKPLLGTKSVRKLRTSDLDHTYATLMANGMTPNTAAKVAKHMRALLDQAYKHEIVHRNVSDAVKPIKQVPYEAIPPSADDVVRLVDAAMVDHEQFGSLVYLGATTGARKGELRGLRWGDVDLTAGTVRFEHQPDEKLGGLRPLKGKRGRTVILDDDTVKMLKAHKATVEAVAGECGGTIAPECFVFSEIPGNTEPMRLWYVNWRFDRIRKRLGLDATRIHDLRHAQATTLLNSGVPPQVVAARLGHSSATITMSVYAHSDAAQDRRAANLGALKRSS
jgi:integrase